MKKSKRLVGWLVCCFLLIGYSSCNQDEDEARAPQSVFELNIEPQAKISHSIKYYDPNNHYYTHRKVVIECTLEDSNYTDTLFTRWDFDGDGVWDVNWTKEALLDRNGRATGATHLIKFQDPGRKVITLEVRDMRGGRFRDTNSIVIKDSTGDIYNTPPDFKEFVSRFSIHMPFDVTLEWEFEDPEDHEMTYDLFVHVDGEAIGDPIAANLSEAIHKTDLKPETNYNWFVVATDEFGLTSKSPDRRLKICPDPRPCPGQEFVYDREGNKYETVEICGDCWLKTNLNTLDMGRWSKYCRDNDTANCETYGGYYDIEYVVSRFGDNKTQAICPDGFYLPHQSDWGELIVYSELENVLMGGKTGIELKLTGYMGYPDESTTVDFDKAGHYWSGIITSSQSQVFILQEDGTSRTEQMLRRTGKRAPIRCIAK